MEVGVAAAAAVEVEAVVVEEAEVAVLAMMTEVTTCQIPVVAADMVAETMTSDATAEAVADTGVNVVVAAVVWIMAAVKVVDTAAAAAAVDSKVVAAMAVDVAAEVVENVVAEKVSILTTDQLIDETVLIEYFSQDSGVVKEIGDALIQIAEIQISHGVNSVIDVTKKNQPMPVTVAVIQVRFCVKNGLISLLRTIDFSNI